MTLVEGVGDEVTQFFIALLVVGLALIAWWSTNISETPLVRTVLVLERRRVESTPARNEQQITRPPDSSNNAVELPNNPEVAQEPEVADEVASSTISNDEPKEENEITATTTSSENTPPAELRRRRVEAIESKTIVVEQTPIDAMEVEEETSDGSIRIRLKYLNDEQKLVQGRLTEPLGDFKRRHFDLELSANKLVRLIFNGQVLARDTASLEEHGLFDNCVIHCLVHQPRNVTSNTAGSTEGNTAPNREEQREANESNGGHMLERREIDLGTLLYVILPVLIGLAWYLRYVYSQYFTNTASVALIGLTGLLAVSFVGYMMPDQELIR
ncbi:transmembrane and ubiquitin-like domain-containing protein 1 [Neocloeon triangulifer]|uniref:transmembrane and ubiquitin-like domain-containing protein 1 n=1 Tax=Neocloeon triangulifer TaxID=2078957 RepID=UPI00286EEED7|nr:transmembrane and ubiquitin-like domain-containing protein 1 [Neocloeon triangulifer]XP_059486754.1 transmembrane and ubiquitin-like domain-containing protein 1 [Neocloeon triangulifer]